MRVHQTSVASICAALLLVAAGSISAQTLRVTTWTFSPNPSPSDLTNELSSSAEALKKTDPDVILLQQVRDWRTCLQLIEELKPAAYSVAVCSSFREPGGSGIGHQQAAILSKRKAYFSWSEAWRGQGDQASGGFAFAALQVGPHRIGFFCAELDDQLLRATAGKGTASALAEASCREQWSQGVHSFQEWVSNRLEMAVVAGGVILSGGSPAKAVDSARRERGAQLVCQFLGSPLAAVPGVDGQVTRVAASSTALPAALLCSPRQTCEVDLELAPPLPIPAQENSTRQDLAKVQNAAAVAPRTTLGNPLVWIGALGALVLVLLALWLRSVGQRVALARTRALGPGHLDRRLGEPNAAGDAVIITSGSVTRSSGDMPSRSSLQLEQLRTTQAQLHIWQQRALAAEGQAERVQQAIRGGVLADLRAWMKQKLVRGLIEDRSTLLETQHAAALKALAVDERLARVEVQLQEQNHAYERRIEHLTRELAATKEEGRALIRAQIAQVKAEMDAARSRLLAEAGRRQTDREELE